MNQGSPLTIAALLCVIAVSGCRKRTHLDTPVADTPVAPAAPSHALLPPTDVVEGASIYPLQAQLTNQAGANITLDVHRGHVVLVSMFYSSCPSACPTLIQRLKKVEAALPDAVRSDVRILLVSFDPDHDTLEVLRALPEAHHVAAERWTFARTGHESVREIAAVLGIKYRQDDGSFNHSSVIALLDREGRLDQRYDALEAAVQPVADRVRQLTSRVALPSSPRSGS